MLPSSIRPSPTTTKCQFPRSSHPFEVKARLAKITTLEPKTREKAEEANGQIREVKSERQKMKERICFFCEHKCKDLEEFRNHTEAHIEQFKKIF